MQNLIALILILFLLPLITWSLLFLIFNEFNHENLDLKGIKRVLVIFPHPDDEVLTAGGTISLMSKKGIKVFHYILTKGEKGNEKGITDENLKTIRTKEAEKSSMSLGTDLKILDMGDGILDGKREKLKKTVSSIIESVRPDMIITYDPSGLYGHTDHIAVSETVTNLVDESYSSIRLCYVSFPKISYKFISLPTEMAKDNNFMEKRLYPNRKIFIGKNIFKKLQVWRVYKSQNLKKNIPVPLIPDEFFYSLSLYEYFHESKKIGD